MNRKVKQYLHFELMSFKSDLDLLLPLGGFKFLMKKKKPYNAMEKKVSNILSNDI